ncbi:MAG: polyprenyl synthetase family protein [Chlamydiota bacterium]
MRLAIEASLQELVESLGERTCLRDAIGYSLLSEGKRLRPLLLLLVSEALGKGYDAMPAALAVECFHSASLIADDLPCMDNEKERRGLPCVHHIYPESVTILASYTLISLGYEYIHKNAARLPLEKEAKSAIGMRALATVTQAAGIFGATNGQFLDLFPPDQSLGTIETIMEQKTVTLFTISCVCGWLFGGGEKRRLAQVEKLAYHLGKAFQIRDDLLDLAEDLPGEKNSNFATLLGKEKARQHLEENLLRFSALLEELEIATPELLFLARRLQKVPVT